MTNGSTMAYWVLAVSGGAGAGFLESIDWINLPFGAGIMVAFAFLLRFILTKGDEKLDRILRKVDDIDDRLKNVERNSSSTPNP